MDKKEIQRKHKKVLTYINEELNLDFEMICFKDSTFLLGVREERSIWIYMDKGELKTEVSFYAKGARYKRKQSMKNFELTEEKFHQVLMVAQAFLENLEEEVKEEKIKKMFNKGEIQGKNLVNDNMIKVIEYYGNVREQEIDFWNEEKVLAKISDVMKQTKYNKKERFIPLLQGVEKHWKYDVGYLSKWKESKKVSVLRTASNKIIMAKKENETLQVFESVKEFIQAYEKNPTAF